MSKYYLLILISLFFVSCNDAKQKKLGTLIKEWEQRTILFPGNSVFTIQGKDTVASPIGRGYKIVSYVDSIGCTNCKMRLHDWTEFIACLNTNIQPEVPFYFFFYPKDIKEMKYILKRENFAYPVCIDIGNTFYEMNKLPEEEAFRTFLLDADNKVIAIGNPIHNPKVQELYLKIIRGEKMKRKDESKIIKTEVDIDKTSISLGSFNWKEEQKRTFTLKNIGDELLVVENVNTSCGCTIVEYPNEPVCPGANIELHVIYKAEHPEHFNKTITVYCNAETSPIKLTIKGDAE